MQTLIDRARSAGGREATDLGVAHGWLLDLARCCEANADTAAPCDGAAVRLAVETQRNALPARYPDGQVPAWLRPKAEYVGLILRRLADGLYHCYDIPALPRTDNAMEQCYRQLKAGERRATGHRRSDAFVVRVGGFAAYATAASTVPEATLLDQLATVPASACQRCRAALRATQERQTKMRRFHLHPDRYLSDLEARWATLAASP